MWANGAVMGCPISSNENLYFIEIGLVWVRHSIEKPWYLIKWKSHDKIEYYSDYFQKAEISSSTQISIKMTVIQL